MPILKRASAILAATALAAATAGGQPRQPPIKSPTVSAEGIEFRVRAPDASTLFLQAPWAGGRLPFEKGADGIWTLNVGPVPPAIYSYTLVLNGVRVLDPHNSAVKRWQGGNSSVVEVPAAEPKAYDLQDVPHGVVHTHHYKSTSETPGRRLLIYTPPGYAEQPDQRFPVLYLLHGSGDDETAWTEVGRANLILDNLIARGDAAPMLVVMPNGHPVPWAARRRGLATGNTEQFRRDLFEAVIPFVDAHYRTKADRESRAIAGLSMGGGQSLACAMAGLDRFAWVGAYSSAAPDPASDPVASDFLADRQRANSLLRLLWIAIGRDDFLLERNQAFKAALDKSGINHTYLLTAGGHSWPVWRDYLSDFATLLFRDGEQR